MGADVVGGTVVGGDVVGGTLVVGGAVVVVVVGAGGQSPGTSIVST